MALLDDLLAEQDDDGDDPFRRVQTPRVQSKPKSAVATAKAPIATTDLSPVICKAQTTVRHPRDHPNPELRGKPILDADNKRQYRPCEARAMKGQEVCVAHGGRAPQAQAAAKLRLLAATEPLVAALLHIGLNETLSAADRTRAIVAALDRAGFRAGLDLNVETPLWQQAVLRLQQEFGVPSLDDPDRTDVIEAEVVGTALTPEEIMELNKRAGGERFAAEEAEDSPEARADWVSASEALPQEWRGSFPRRKRSRR